MTRIVSAALVVLLIMNGMATAMTASGFSEDIGVTLNPGAEQTLNETVAHAKEGFSASGGGITQSFVGVALAALGTIDFVVTGMTTAAPVMFLNLGFPEWIVVPLFAPMYVLTLFYFIYIVTGTRGI